MSLTTIKEEYQAHLQAMEATVQLCQQTMEEIAACIVECFRQGRKLLICGNGGSAADAQHVAAEFVNRFRSDRAALPAIALTTDTSIITAIGNDSAYEYVFSRQVEALGRPGDILAAISTSGKSASVLKALETARALGLTNLGFTSKNGRLTMEPKCDHCLIIPSEETPRIQECHLFAWHVICGNVEETLFKK
jgi:D-sedoheptulose 7-phosphate isomerase